MILNVPNLLNNKQYLEASLNFKWNAKISLKIFPKSENDKFIDIINKISHKAKIGLAAALGEWVIWQMYQHKINQNESMDKEFKILETYWAGAIDKYYFNNKQYGLNNEDNSKMNETLYITLASMKYLQISYIKSSYFVGLGFAPLVNLINYITPNKILFENWLSDSLKRLVRTFPAVYDPSTLNNFDYEDEKYDSTPEFPVPREFFFQPDFDYQTADIPQLLNNFLSQLDYNNNEFLSKPEEMLEKGFAGTPYVYTQS